MPGTRFARGRTTVAATFAGLAMMLASAVAPPVLAQSKQVLELGQAEFEFLCTVCHGPHGKGNGDMASILATPPADLTQIAKRNGGVYPFWQIYAIIGGEASVAGHQRFEMPGFWRKFRREEGTQSLLPAEMRILVLTHYVESLQDR